MAVHTGGWVKREKETKNIYISNCTLFCVSFLLSMDTCQKDDIWYANESFPFHLGDAQSLQSTCIYTDAVSWYILQVPMVRATHWQRNTHVQWERKREQRARERERERQWAVSTAGTRRKWSARYAREKGLSERGYIFNITCITFLLDMVKQCMSLWFHWLSFSLCLTRSQCPNEWLFLWWRGNC